MNLDDKRREKNGGYSKKSLVEQFLSEQEDIEEFSIVCTYKNGEVGVYHSTEDKIQQVGMMEVGKGMSILDRFE
ncbi:MULTISPECIES: hypothetical protein [Shouchella]|uniref:hypothetical protein n=1 Tax=Shouchella TaxID=2893057 RepID=UPI0005A0A488|nr:MULTISPECIES: hypothetical protein [Shouchella]PAF08679.1 hypothetical protein CHH65_13910 [Shouchella clausii]